MRAHRHLAFLIVALLAIPGDRAGTPGLPFVEDFTDASLRDGAHTFADWSTEEATRSHTAS